MVFRKRLPELSDKRPVLDYMGRCRLGLVAQAGTVQAQGPRYRAIQVVIDAIDALATDLTGNDMFYAVQPSVGADDRNIWRDQGTR